MLIISLQSIVGVGVLVLALDFAFVKLQHDRNFIIASPSIYNDKLR